MLHISNFIGYFKNWESMTPSHYSSMRKFWKKRKKNDYSTAFLLFKEESFKNYWYRMKYFSQFYKNPLKFSKTKLHIFAYFAYIVHILTFEVAFSYCIWGPLILHWKKIPAYLFYDNKILIVFENCSNIVYVKKIVHISNSKILKNYGF